MVIWGCLETVNGMFLELIHDQNVTQFNGTLNICAQSLHRLGAHLMNR